MMSLSNAARRSALMAARRAPVVASRIPAAFSTQTHTQVQEVVDQLSAMHWAYPKDVVQEIRCLMNEPKTNLGIRRPNANLENEVSEYMNEIQKMISNNTCNQGDVQAHLIGLARKVKAELYP